MCTAGPLFGCHHPGLHCCEFSLHIMPLEQEMLLQPAFTSVCATIGVIRISDAGVKEADGLDS